MKKIFLTCLLSALCLTTAFAVNYSGTCGENITWELTDSVLTISGTGAMNNFTSSSQSPWYSYKTDIKKVIINEGVTSVGNFAFEQCKNLSMVSFPQSLLILGEKSFENCKSLTSVSFPLNLQMINNGAMAYTGLTEITIPHSVERIESGAFNGNDIHTATFNGDTPYYAPGLFTNNQSLPIIYWNVRRGNDYTQSIFFHTIYESPKVVYIGDNVDTIPQNLCGSLYCLEYVEIGKNVKYISSGAINYCPRLTKVKIHAEVPPDLHVASGINFSISADTIIVPCNSLAAYKNAVGWRNMNIVGDENCESTTYTVSVSSANTSMGTVSGGGTYEEGATATVTATPKSGYKFRRWSNGNTTNPYSFTVTSNVSLTAYFEQSSTPQPESSTFWNMSDAAFNSLGTITSTKTINGLTIKATSDKAVTIDADAREIDGLSFTHRLKFGGTGTSDARLLSFHVNGNCDIDVYLMSASGTADRTLNVDKGSFGNNLQQLAAPAGTITKGTVHYTGSATTIYLYSPSSGVNIYAIRVTEESSSSTTSYTVSVSSANSSMGTVSGGGQYDEGSTATVIATPKSGYKFTKWSNGSTANPYSFTVTQNVSLTAYFEQSSTPQPTSKFWNMSDAAFNSLGTISSNKTINGLTIHATSSKNVVIDENSQAIDGLSFTHRLKFGGTGASDARLLSFQVNGDCDIDIYLMSASGTADRILNVDKGSFGNSWKTIPALGGSISKGTVHYTGNATTIYLYSPSSGVNIYAIRVAEESSSSITTYTVSVSSANSSMGTVSGGGQYEEGSTATITATPKSGYKFTKWSNGSTANPYSFTVTQNISLTAHFEQSSTPQQESKFWNISDAAFNSLGKMTSTITINGLTIYATSEKAVTVDTDSEPREIDGFYFTHRLKFGGTGTSNARLLSFQVIGDCNIDIYLMSASGSADRTLNVDKGNFGNTIETIPALRYPITKGTVHYTGSATTIYLYSPSSGVNIYAIRLSYGNSQDINNPTIGKDYKTQKILYNGQIFILRGDKTYTLQGQEVK